MLSDYLRNLAHTVEAVASNQIKPKDAGAFLMQLAGCLRDCEDAARQLENPGVVVPESSLEGFLAALKLTEEAAT